MMSRWKRTEVAVLVSFLFLALSFLPPGCGPGCGPGSIPSNPVFSNLVDFTDPASQSILRPGRFESFEVYFIEAVEKASFGVSDDMGMCLLEEGEEYCNPEDPVQGVDPSTVFSNASWSCYNSNVCRPGDPEYDPAMADRLSLDVSASGLEPGRYMVKLQKDGDTPITSKDGYHLKDNVDVYIRMVSDEAPTERPYIEYSTIDEYGWYPPHAPLNLLFSQNMGFINFIVDKPCLGFNFEYGAIMLLRSDSIQGMAPGELYSIDVISDDVAPNGVPWTMDAFGNTMESTYSESFKTGHVRITFPLHDPFSVGPDDWGVQLENVVHEEHAVFVEITEHVDKLMFYRGGHRGDISFADRIPTAEELYDDEGNRKRSAVIRIDIDPAGIPVCDPDNEMEIFHWQLLEVHASKSVNGGWSYRGWDRLYVDPFPPDYEVGFPENYVYLGDQPHRLDAKYTDELQGVAHDHRHWYFSKNRPTRLLKVPVEMDLEQDFDEERPEDGLYIISIEETTLADFGYDHFGDIEAMDGFIYVPIYIKGDETTDHKTAIAVFYSSPEGGDFQYVGYDRLTEQQKAGWCALKREGDHLMLYSSEHEINEDTPIKKYEVNVDFDPDTGQGDFTLSYVQGGDIYLMPGWSYWNQLPDYDGRWKLRHMQGGIFSERGHLYLVNGGYEEGGGFNRYKGGIWVFSVNGNEAILVEHSNQETEPGTFEFQFHPRTVLADYMMEEPEGIDIWDLDSGIAPDISGQIHVIMIDNAGAGHDDFYFKHYAVSSGDKCKI